jgi:multimeric flavodoxin WrbA
MTAVVYYSYSGNTRKKAEKFAKAHGLPIIEVTMKKPYGKLTAFLSGCPKAMGRKSVPIDISRNLAEYDSFAVFMPVWAGHPAPPFNALVDALPKGASVELFLCSAGGETLKSEATAAFCEGKGIKLKSYTDIKA